MKSWTPKPAPRFGTVDHTPFYPREVVKRALELSATALILVHNHPTQGGPYGIGEHCELGRRSLRSGKPFSTRWSSLMLGIKRIW
jgi:hypothetical protein